MAYTKQNWNTGETITADKLNHMEDGIMESGRVVFAEYTITSSDDFSGTCNMSHDDIVQLLESKTPVVMLWAHKPEGAPFYLTAGACLVQMNTSALRFEINNTGLMCRSGNDWQTY